MGDASADLDILDPQLELKSTVYVFSVVFDHFCFVLCSALDNVSLV